MVGAPKNSFKKSLKNSSSEDKSFEEAAELSIKVVLLSFSVVVVFVSSATSSAVSSETSSSWVSTDISAFELTTV